LVFAWFLCVLPVVFFVWRATFVIWETVHIVGVSR